ncbi:ABC1 kinase family protein [Paraburkholderia caballeronis]|uniref:ABC1 kinase family protein n=1 Tax=Paraburkholderia caballeronis TaxID=416943 RepID=UPI001066BB01|nr:AarF/UbiB family protein [Paraburkholderia caballeronis]
MRSRLRRLRLFFCALRYGFRLIWLASPKHHRLHWLLSLASRMRDDARLSAQLHGVLPQLAPLAGAFARTLATRPQLAVATLHDAVNAIGHFEAPLAPDELDAALHAAFGEPPSARFAWVDPQPVSNGWCEQTHVARLARPVNGHPAVTIRVLRTAQVQQVDDDAALLCAVARWLERVSRGARRLRLRALADALRDDLHRRFDLRAQAANLSQSGHHFDDDPRVIVPDVIWDLCTARTLTVQHIDTVRATDVAALAAHRISVAGVAAHLVEVIARQAFEHGFFHAALDARHVAVSIEPPTAGRLVLAGAALMSSLSSPEREFFVHGATALFEQDYGRLATLHQVAGHVPPQTRPERLEAELRTRSEAHFAAEPGERSAGALLHQLLHAVQPFGGQVSPRLAAAQRAFGEAEALARAIHPDVDAWGIAQRTFADIARRELGHRGWLRSLSKELPHLAQIVPRMPRLVIHSLQHQLAAAPAHAPHAQQTALVAAFRREQRRTRALLIACAVCGGLIGAGAMLFVL